MTLSFLKLCFLICEIVIAAVSLDGIKRPGGQVPKDNAYCTVGTQVPVLPSLRLWRMGRVGEEPAKSGPRCWPNIYQLGDRQATSTFSASVYPSAKWSHLMSFFWVSDNCKDYMCHFQFLSFKTILQVCYTLWKYLYPTWKTLNWNQQTNNKRANMFRRMNHW